MARKRPRARTDVELGSLTRATLGMNKMNAEGPKMYCTDECTALSVQTQQAFNNKGYAWPFPLALTGICGEASAMSRKLLSSPRPKSIGSVSDDDHHSLHQRAARRAPELLPERQLTALNAVQRVLIKVAVCTGDVDVLRVPGERGQRAPRSIADDSARWPRPEGSRWCAHVRAEGA